MSLEGNVSDLRDLLPGREEITEAFRQLAAVLSAPVTTLMQEGWTEAQAREIVSAAFAQSARSEQAKS